VQALLAEARLAGDWTLDGAKSTIGLRSRSMWALARVNGVFGQVTGHGTVSPTGEVSGTITVPGGERFVTPVLGVDRVCEGKLARAQIFSFDTAAVLRFLEASGTPAATARPTMIEPAGTNEIGQIESMAGSCACW
jgi:hypothetical protein